MNSMNSETSYTCRCLSDVFNDSFKTWFILAIRIIFYMIRKRGYDNISSHWLALYASQWMPRWIVYDDSLTLTMITIYTQLVNRSNHTDCFVVCFMKENNLFEYMLVSGPSPPTFRVCSQYVHVFFNNNDPLFIFFKLNLIDNGSIGHDACVTFFVRLHQ
jgi:hypothetical protein